jgi:nucleoside-triphosphatase THEP1
VLYQMVCDTERTVSLDDLLRFCQLEPHPNKEAIKREFIRDRAYWTKPLSHAAQQYAAADVDQLLQAAAYLLRQLPPARYAEALHRSYARCDSDTQSALGAELPAILGASTTPPLFGAAQRGQPSATEWTVRRLVVADKVAPAVGEALEGEERHLISLLPEALQASAAEAMLYHAGCRLLEVRVDLGRQPVLVLWNVARMYRMRPVCIAEERTTDETLLEALRRVVAVATGSALPAVALRGLAERQRRVAAATCLVNVSSRLGATGASPLSSAESSATNVNVVELLEADRLLRDPYDVEDGDMEALARYFTDDNRALLPRTLHRISGLPALSPERRYKGLSYRVGRHVPGSIAPFEDVVRRVAQWTDPSQLHADELLRAGAWSPFADAGTDANASAAGRSRPSLLLIGPPGVGKTTLLRALSACLARPPHNLSVVVIDTSGEIAGGGDYAHDCIEPARTLHVPRRSRQADVMREAVQNHMPEVMIIDEIGSAAEVQAAREIRPKGVSLIATAHGATLHDVSRNPLLRDLLGARQQVILNAQEAKDRARGSSDSGTTTGRVSKSQTERIGVPVFDIAIEIHAQNHFVIYHSVADCIDRVLRGDRPICDERVVHAGDATVHSRTLS